MLRELAEALSKYYAPEAEIYLQHQRNIGWAIMQRWGAGAISHGYGLTASETRQWLRGALAGCAACHPDAMEILRNV